MERQSKSAFPTCLVAKSETDKNCAAKGLPAGSKFEFSPFYKAELGQADCEEHLSGMERLGFPHSRSGNKTVTGPGPASPLGYLHNKLVFFQVFFCKFM